MSYFKVRKKNKTKSGFINVKMTLILILAFIVGLVNLNVLTVKAGVDVTFDFQTDITGSTTPGDPSGFNRTATQAKSGYTLTVTQDNGNLLAMDGSSYNSGPITNLNDNIIIVDGYYDVTNKLTLASNGSYTFDLTRITVMDQKGMGLTLKFQTSKGAVTASVGASDGQIINLNDAKLKGVSSVEITDNSGGTIQLEMDDIILQNITPMLSQVANVALSDSGVATWNDVANESSFEAQLYKNGVEQGSAVPIAANTLTCDFLSAMRAAGAGAYTVKVTAKGDGANYADGPQSAVLGSQTITKLTTVAAGTWTGDIANWTPVLSAVSYNVQLYKGGISLNAPVNVATNSADFTAAIATDVAANGGGTYTYKVTAIGNTTLLLDAAQSVASSNNIKAIQLPQVTGATISPYRSGKLDSCTECVQL